MFSLAAVVNLTIRATRLISGGIILVSTGRNIVSVGLIHPVTIHKVSFSTQSSW